MRYTIQILVLLLVFTSACSGAQKKGVPSEELTLDPMLIRPGGDGTETIDVTELFARAFDAFSSRRYDVASRDYELIIRHFPESRFFLPSLYNAGLSYERTERWSEAAEKYQMIIDKFPHKKDATDAYFRAAGAHERLGNHKIIVDLMTDVLLRNDISTYDRVESHLRRASALAEVGSLIEAEDAYRTVLRVNGDARPTDKVAENAHLIVKTYFGLGNVLHRQTNEIPLVLPPEKMGEALRAKATKFTSAQANYIRALSYHHPQWSMAAGYQIGRLYEDFYTAIFGAEIPDDLTEEQIALYFEELRKQIRPLMERAVQVYQKNLSLSKRIGATARENEWVAQTTTHLNRLKLYLDDPKTQKRAERFVRNKRDLALLWEPLGIAIDSVQIAYDDANKVSKPKTTKPSN